MEAGSGGAEVDGKETHTCSVGMYGVSGTGNDAARAKRQADVNRFRS
jgi:hypothetical protein